MHIHVLLTAVHCKTPDSLNSSEVIFVFLHLKMHFVLRQKEKAIVLTVNSYP